MSTRFPPPFLLWIWNLLCYLLYRSFAWDEAFGVCTLPKSGGHYIPGCLGPLLFFNLL